MTPSAMIIFAVVPVVIWHMYSRIRRLIGRQKSRIWRHLLAAIFCPLLLALLTLGALASPFAMASILGGMAVGGGLGIWGLRLTRFEKTDAGFFYTPSAHIGIALSVLLVARVGYRLLQIAAFTTAESQASLQGLRPQPIDPAHSGNDAGVLRYLRDRPVALAAPRKRREFNCGRRQLIFRENSSTRAPLQPFGWVRVSSVAL